MCIYIYIYTQLFIDLFINERGALVYLSKAPELRAEESLHASFLEWWFHGSVRGCGRFLYNAAFANATSAGGSEALQRGAAGEF